MPPSDRATFSCGNLWKTRENNTSAVGYIGLQPKREMDDEGDEAVGRRRAPLLEDEVVVGAHAGQGQVLVVGLQEDGAGEPRERRETELRLHTVAVHVEHPGPGVVATGPHLVVARGLEA